MPNTVRRKPPATPTSRVLVHNEPQDTVPVAPATGLPADVIASFDGIAPPAPGSVDAHARPDAQDIDGYRLELPRENWAEIASVDEIPNSTLNKVKSGGLRVARLLERGETDDLPSLNSELAAHILAHLVTAWSLPQPLPVTAQILGELPARTAILLEKAAERALNAVRADIEPSMDPSSPTRPSAG